MFFFILIAFRASLHSCMYRVLLIFFALYDNKRMVSTHVKMVVIHVCTYMFLVEKRFVKVVRLYIRPVVVAFVLFIPVVSQSAVVEGDNSCSVGIADLSALDNASNLNYLRISHFTIQLSFITEGVDRDKFIVDRDKLIKEDPHVRFEIACLRAVHLLADTLPPLASFPPEFNLNRHL